MPKGCKIKLPKEILVIKNKDKDFHESWSKKRDLLNIPHPFRGVLMGPPNIGKSMIIKNIIVRADPEFEEIFVIHPDVEYTKEYDDIGATMLKEIPSPDEWEGLVKTLVIIDDIELRQLNKDQKRNLDRLFGYVSTHKNISVLLTSQDAFAIPTIVRRCSNLLIIWKNHDMDSLATLARKSGLSSSDLKTIFSTVATGDRDSLWIDLTSKSPAKLRINGYTVLNEG